ncbi:MAG TPA: heavy metal translocating P-type ATPase metal-binding domain-containing protein, partial [Bacteroidia bacterium]|nr:heavy metal translocating P-type ATPase metal-binding domain-containing protein [Bacteroidia bacterium]
MEIEAQVLVKLTCYHCGEDCPDPKLREGDKHFCCEGCRLVFHLLDRNGMCEYYELGRNPGLNRRIQVREGKFNFLDDEQVKSRLVSFSDGKRFTVNFYLPQMHCSSCIWLLENLHRLEPGIVSSRVDFPAKEVSIVSDADACSLRRIAELLTEIGYEPHISLKDMDERKIRKTDRRRLLRLGIAGFCFGNIMMFSFPEYLSGGRFNLPGLGRFFQYLNLMLAMPVFFFSASEFYISAWKGLRAKFLNIDAPIVLAILITFIRSVYEIVSGTGSGYLDSMSGIVFFMLAGRVFQDYTHQALSFERDYKSYFPVSVTVRRNEKESDIPVSALLKGDRIIIRHGELIPADGIMILGQARIDYSFVTGESLPVQKMPGEIIYAGGRQCAGKIELELVREVPQSYLTRLWSSDAFKKKTPAPSGFIHALSRNFTWVLLSLAAVSAVYWSFADPSKVLNAVTSVLIVACPCALLLSSAFTNGNILRVLAREG